MQVGQCWACILTGVTQGFNGHVSPEDDGILAACPSDPHCRSRCPARHTEMWKNGALMETHHTVVQSLWKTLSTISKLET